MGESHRMTLLAGVNLGEVILLRGRESDAENLARSISERASGTLGEESAVTAGARAVLARSLMTLGDADEAERQFRLAIDSDRAGGRESLMSLETRMFFCQLLADQGRFDEARAELASLRATIEEKLGSDHALAEKGAEIAAGLGG